jgi:hypothetical protein
MPKNFPIDEFDSAISGGGRHRAARTARDQVREWLRVVVAAAVISVGGYLSLSLIGQSSVFAGYIPSINPNPTASTQALPEVSVLDGGGAELGAAAGQVLRDAGFNVTGASVLVDSDSKPIATAETVVLITDEIFTAAATDIAAKIGNPKVMVSTQFPGPITVVLGADYALPAQ